MLSPPSVGARARVLKFVVSLVVIAATGFALSAITVGSAPASAKTPGSTYCFYGKCHRVKTIAETQRLVGKTVRLNSSHYDDCRKDRYNPCGLTSSGEPFFANRADNAASPIYPDGTKLLVWSPTSKEAAVVRINNAGPYWGNRKLDVSRALARKLGFERRGVAKLETRVLSAPTRKEARYKRNRRYQKVKGPIGKFASLDEAEKGLAVLLAFDAMTTAMVGSTAGHAVARVETPFAVAARVTEGRAFASVRPKLKNWPVFDDRQFQVAKLERPVVKAPQPRIAPVKRAARIASWPVVHQPVAVGTRKTARIKIARAEPVVVNGQKTLTSQNLDEPKAPVRVAKAMLKVEKPSAQRKTRALVGRRLSKRVKTVRSRRVKLAKVAGKKRRAKKRKQRIRVGRKASKKKMAKRVAKKVAKNRVKGKRGSSKLKVARLNKKAKPRRMTQKRIAKAKPRPYVAVRSILHRNLGRGA